MKHNCFNMRIDTSKKFKCEQKRWIQKSSCCSSRSYEVCNIEHIFIMFLSELNSMGFLRSFTSYSYIILQCSKRPALFHLLLIVVIFSFFFFSLFSFIYLFIYIFLIIILFRYNEYTTDQIKLFHTIHSARIYRIIVLNRAKNKINITKHMNDLRHAAQEHLLGAAARIFYEISFY